MLILTNAGTDKLQLTSSSAANLDVHVSYVDLNADGTGDPSIGRTNTAISSAATTDILATPAASKVRNVKELHVRNKHATLSCDVTIVYDQNGTDFELHKTTLDAGEALEYIEGVGWFVIENNWAVPKPTYTTGDQSIGASVTAYLTGSAIAIPTNRPVQIGTIFDWTIVMSKTAAATASMTFDVRFGTNGSTSDTSRLSFATGTQSAAADVLIARIRAMVRGPLSASCIVHGAFAYEHNLAATGFGPTANMIGQVTSGAFDITTSGIIAGVSVTTGASHSLTVQQVSGSVTNL